MSVIFGILSGLAGIYSLVILIRIVLTWFSGGSYGRAGNVLAAVTDPYLNWFRRFPMLRVGFIDLSPIAAVAVLSIVQSLFSAIAAAGRVSLGIIAAIVLSAVWSAASFIIGFFIVLVALRLIAYLADLNIRHPFWQIVDGLTQPIIFRLGGLLPRSVTSFLGRLLISGGILLALNIGGGLVIKLVSGLLLRLPV